jgi:uncharacterized ion transporter superfamily protein YfcC
LRYRYHETAFSGKLSQTRLMKLQLPHPFVLLLGAVAVAALLTWIIPAGEYQRRKDEATGREVVVAGTYARVAAAPVGLKAALIAVPRGIIAGADVILTILFVGGAFALLEATGALARLVGMLVGRTQRPRIIVTAVSLAFATLGALENMQEEIIALVAVLALLSRGLGFGNITALAMSAGAAAVGAAFCGNAAADDSCHSLRPFACGCHSVDRLDAGDGCARRCAFCGSATANRCARDEA